MSRSTLHAGFEGITERSERLLAEIQGITQALQVYYAELLQSGEGATEDVKRCVQTLEKNGNTLRKASNQLYAICAFAFAPFFAIGAVSTRCLMLALLFAVAQGAVMRNTTIWPQRLRAWLIKKKSRA